MRRINSMKKYDMRVSLCAKFGGRCAYCNRAVGMRNGTIDHYMPQALGGTNAGENLRWCCFSCNQLKGDMHPDEWAQHMPEPVVDDSKARRRINILSDLAKKQRAAVSP